MKIVHRIKELAVTSITIR